MDRGCGYLIEKSLWTSTGGGSGAGGGVCECVCVCCVHIPAWGFLSFALPGGILIMDYTCVSQVLYCVGLSRFVVQTKLFFQSTRYTEPFTWQQHLAFEAMRGSPPYDRCDAFLVTF